jgi:hypothetical protein
MILIYRQYSPCVIHKEDLCPSSRDINRLMMNASIYYVRLTARHAIHLQFHIIANALEIRAVQNPKCLV